MSLTTVTAILSFLIIFISPTNLYSSITNQENAFKTYLTSFSTKETLSEKMVELFIPDTERIAGRIFRPRGVMARNSKYVKVMMDFTCESYGACNGMLIVIYEPDGTLISSLVVSYDYGDCVLGSGGTWLVQNRNLIIMQERSWKEKCDDLIGEVDQYKITEYKISPQGLLTTQRAQTVGSEREYPAVSVRLLSDLELEQMTPKGIATMRNELFATYGYKFKSEEWSDYFKEKIWYRPEVSEVDKSQLSLLERKNLEIILNYEKNQN